MADEKDQPKQELKAFDWKSNGAPEIYSNYFHLGWTLDDVRITLGSLRAENVSTKVFFAEEKGTIILPWRQVKNLRDSLAAVVADYEERNGKIGTPFLPDVGTAPKAAEPPHES